MSPRRQPGRRLRAGIVTVAALLLVSWSGPVRAQAALPALGADPAATSVSGLSAGAFVASQFHIAPSRTVIGVGIVAGGPYGCAEAATPWFARWYGLGAVVYWATGRCMQGSRLGYGIPDTATLEAQVRDLATAD